MTLYCIEAKNCFNVYEDNSGKLVYQIFPISEAYKFILNKSEVYNAKLMYNYFAFASPYISKLIFRASHCYGNELTDIFKNMHLYIRDNKTTINTIFRKYPLDKPPK